jgi:hypothetical protein
MAKALRDTPWPILLLLASFLCPTELSVYVGSARIPPHRAVILALLPFAIARFLGSAGPRTRLFDVAFIGFATWTSIAYLTHHGLSDGLQTAGAQSLDSFGAYLLARAYIRDRRALQATCGALFIAILVAGAIALPETIGGRIFVHELMRGLTGYAHPVGVETRLGLTRAYGTFDHPIHLGTFCGAAFSLLVYASGGTGALLRLFLIPACVLTGVSSAPLLGVFVQMGLAVIEKGTRGLRGRVAAGVVVVVVLVSLMAIISTRSPFAIIATGFTLDSLTGFYRLVIWENGLENVWSSPLFGIGLNDWKRPYWMVSSTIDAFWLVIAMRTGIPSFLLLVLAVLSLGRAVSRAMRPADKLGMRLARGWLISVVAFVLVGCTVHYWNVPYAFFFFFLGLGGCLADPEHRAPRAAATVQSDAPPAVRWLTPDAVAGTAGSPVWSNGPPRWPVPVAASQPIARSTAPPGLRVSSRPAG